MLGVYTVPFGQFHRNGITFSRIFLVFNLNIWEKRVLSVVSVKVLLCSGWERLLSDIYFCHYS